MIFNKRFFIITLSILTLILITFGITDLDYIISSNVVNQSSIWGGFFNIFGELPMYIGAVLTVTILFGSRQTSVRWQYWVTTIVGLLVLALFSFMLFYIPIHHGFESREEGIPLLFNILAIIGALIVFIISVIWTIKTPKETLIKLKKTSLLILSVILTELIIVTVIKTVWARPRMRSIESISEFHYWYQIAGFTTDNEFMSFPSGHTANATVFITFVLYVQVLKPTWKKKFLSIAIIWAILVACSRVVVGAHYVTDVVVGGFVTLMSFALWLKIFKYDGVKQLS